MSHPPSLEAPLGKDLTLCDLIDYLQQVLDDFPYLSNYQVCHTIYEGSFDPILRVGVSTRCIYFSHENRDADDDFSLTATNEDGITCSTLLQFLTTIPDSFHDTIIVNRPWRDTNEDIVEVLTQPAFDGSSNGLMVFVGIEFQY